MANLAPEINRRHRPFVVPELTEIVGKSTQVLGEGSYAEVYLTENNYAVKKITDESVDQLTLREVAIIRYLEHPNVINPYAVQVEPFQIAMPLAKYDLSKVPLPKIEERKWVFQQIFRGIDYIHSKLIWHQDLKPQNILLFDHDGTWLIKIADFGISEFNPPKRNIDYEIISYPWRPPEVTFGERFDSKVDIWSIGVMLLDMIQPGSYEGSLVREADLMQKYIEILGVPTDEESPEFQFNLEYRSKRIPINLNVRFSWDGFDPQELEVVKSCLTWARYRKSAKEILQLPYFDQYRKALQIKFPAEQYQENSCLEVLTDNQIPIHGKYEEYRTLRKHIFEWAWDVMGSNYVPNTRYYNHRFYAFYLIDMINDHMQLSKPEMAKYVYACSTLSQIYMHNRNFLYGSSDRLEINQMIRSILEKLDFKLMFSTIYDFFILDHLDLSEIEKNAHIKNLSNLGFLLIYNFEYVRNYTSKQLAQICFEILDLEFACPTEIRLYHSGIQDKLIESWDELMEIWKGPDYENELFLKDFRDIRKYLD